MREINGNNFSLYFLGKLIKKVAGVVKKLGKNIAKLFSRQKLVDSIIKIYNHDRNFDLKPAPGYKR